jgi:GNAT superfamily N-acetyltransferase
MKLDNLSSDSGRVHLVPLIKDKLDVFKDLLGSREFGGCFCAVWTGFDETWEARCADKTQPNFSITRKNVESGKHVGFLVYQDDELVGWTGSGPKTAFPFLKEKLGSRLSEFSENIWSVGCLAVKEAFRGKGISELIIKAVAAEASKNGATHLEAYPTKPFHEPRIFRGTHRLYCKLGFTETTSEVDGDYAIVLMRLELEVPL